MDTGLPELGAKIDLTIEAIGYGGLGVGRLSGLAVFVPMTAVGDRVVVEIEEVRRRYCRARIEKVIFPSPDRTIPLCRVYGLCGGCCYQHMDYESQLLWKERQVKDALERIGGIRDIPMENIVPSPQRYHYRGKVEFQVVKGPGGRLQLGFYEESTNRLVDIERCELACESINETLKSFLNGKGGGEGYRGGKKLILWAGEGGGRAEAHYPGTSAVVNRLVLGQDISVPADGFFQANIYLIDRLVGLVTELAALKGGETVVDGFCGSGLFSLFLAPLTSKLYCIERNEAAIHQTRVNLARAGWSQAKFLRGDVGEVLWGEFVHKRRAVDLLILDPPRSGLGAKTVSALSFLKPRKVIYVSCNPATLARDIKYLSESGFMPISIHPLDMFPQTGHIEVVALLAPAGRGGI